MAKVKYEIKGLRELQKNLTLSIKSMESGVDKNLALLGNKIKNDSMRLTSIDTGETIESAYSIQNKSKHKSRVIIGYSAEKAIYVHDMPNDTNWQRSGATNKFLHKALFANVTVTRTKVIDAVRGALKRISGKAK